VIIEELTIHNFGVYKGEHKINLAPEPHRPVILFGGLNGGGKTTFLDALQVGLYGRHARCVNRTKLGYAEYLRRSVNRAVPPSTGAGIEVTFRYRSGGHEERFRVLRTWREVGSSVREELEVHRDGHLDQMAADRWSEFVERLIPSQISDLFFFDGEKIESLADPDRSAELIGVGIHALLGLNVVDDLGKSLLQVERRKKAKLADELDRATLEPIEADVKHLEEKRQFLVNELGTLRTEWDKAQSSQAAAERTFEAAGGALYEQRSEIDRQLSACVARLAMSEAHLRELCSGVAPLLLVEELLDEAEALATEEQTVRKLSEVREIIAERDKRVLKALKCQGLEAHALTVVKASLLADQKRYAKSASGEVLLGISTEDFTLATRSFRDETAAQIEAAIHAIDHESELLARQQAAHAAIPGDGQIQAALARVQAAHRVTADLDVRIRQLEEERDATIRELEQKERDRARVFDEIAKRLAEEELDRRILGLSERSREVLRSFKQAMRARHVSRLEHLVTESFQRLLRKRSLVDHISIDPETFQLRIHGAGNEIMVADRLSAGERQLLAVSVLWGLARASGRELPSVIDTPLGRLDSEHRRHLVGNYFPFASHQVILLSTDEEIEGRYYRDLKPAIAREYLIRYDEATHTSSIIPGYFEPPRIPA
jgi:DNA sulfur modification protein DndD